MTLHISEEALLLRRQVQLRQGGRLRVRQGQGLHLLHGPRQVRLQEARLQVRQVKGADA